MPKAHKWVYQFTEGSAKMRDLLGGKGAGAAEMTRAGMPVPPGFTITTEACRAYYASGGKFPRGLWEQVLPALKVLERKAGKKLGDPKDPLLVSVRSGAKFSMPGMMDTVLNLGLNDETTKGLAALTKDERFALDARRRFIQMFGKTVKGIDGEKFEHALQEAKKKAGVKTDPELRPEHLRQLVAQFLAIYKEETRREFPSDPVEQLREAAREALQGRAGPRVHHRARQALHAADALGQADRRGGGEHRRRHGQGTPHHQEGGRRSRRAAPAGAAAVPACRSRGQSVAACSRRPCVTRRRVRRRGLRRGHRGGVGQAGQGGDPRSGRDQPERRPRHGRGEGHPHADRRDRLARRAGRPRHGPAVRRRRECDRRRRA